MKLLVALVGLLSFPISFWLQYQVFTRVEATELMWFLYWVNVPLIVLISVFQKLMEDKL